MPDLVDGEICECKGWAHVCGCHQHSHPVGAETAHGLLVHFRNRHWSSACVLRLLAQERAAAADPPPLQAITDAAIDLLRALEEWDRRSSPGQRVLYYAALDHLAAVAKPYREQHGEEVPDPPPWHSEGRLTTFVRAVNESPHDRRTYRDASGDNFPPIETEEEQP